MKVNKVQLRIPAREAYAYLEIECEVNSLQEAVDAYTEASNLYHQKTKTKEEAFADSLPE